MEKTHSSISLLELNNRVKTEIKRGFSQSFWIIAEISEVNINYSGHCYLELIEKNQENGQIIARIKATIWAFTFRIIKPYFESITYQQLSPGLKIMIQASIEFHEIYGFSLNIKDIEPAFTLGDVARRKQEIINKLKAEGVFHLNKEIEFPMVPQRIAVISSSTAAGYGDFIDQLKKNRQGFKFSVTLFQAVMQGIDAEQSIIEALEQIFQTLEMFDAVVIIRGGGSQADLDCFNSYWLCYHITQFPIAIITGIGHERDETIADLVAHTNLKTPTAVAEFLIGQITDFYEFILDAQDRIIALSNEKLAEWKEKTRKVSHSIVSLVNIRMNSEQQRIAMLNQSTVRTYNAFLQQKSSQIKNLQSNIKLHLQHLFPLKLQQHNIQKKEFTYRVSLYLKQKSRNLGQYESSIHFLDPSNVLKRGYSISFVNGKLIKSVTQVKPGDQINSIWVDGTSVSTINEIKQSDYHE